MRFGLWVPPAPFRARLFRRAAVLWLLIRLTLLFFGGLDYLRLMPPTAIAVVILATWFTLLDAARRRETVLLGNLGISRMGLAGPSAVAPVLLELSAWLLLP
jgi:hypothetical protein